jgi:cbb3-type cytochrome oxidase subunit 3
MTREYHLSYCKKCQNRAFNPKKGIVCKLTGEQADFETSCPDFNVDEVQAALVDAEDKVKAANKLKEETFGLDKFGFTNRLAAAKGLVLIGGVWFVLGFGLINRVFIWPVGMVLVGVVFWIFEGKKKIDAKRIKRGELDDIDIDA